MDSVEALQGLHRDLLILTESRLPSLQRLSEELDARLHEFRALLDKPPKKDASRKAIQSGEQYRAAIHHDLLIRPRNDRNR